MTENTLTIIVMLAYFAVLLGIGYYYQKKMTSFDDFVHGGGGQPWFAIAMALLATLVNATQVLGIAGFSYGAGLSFMFWYFIVANIFIYPLMVRFSTKFRGMNFSTIVDFTEERFIGSKRLTLIVALWQIGWAVFSIAMCLFGGGLVIESIFGVPLFVAVGIAAIITAIYTMMGGFRAVIVNEQIQWLIIIFGTAFLMPMIFGKHGTFTDFWSQFLGPTGMTPAEGVNVWAGFTDLFILPPGATALGVIAMGVAGSLWMPTDLGFMHLMLTAKNRKHGNKAILFFCIIITLWATLMLAIGTYATILYPGLEVADAALIVMAQDALPTLGSALFLTAVAAAVMSTVSTYLNAGSAIMVKNVYAKFIKPDLKDEEYLKAARISIILLVLGAFALAPSVSGGGLMATALTVQVLICACLTPLILLSIYWRKFSEKAAFWGNVISVALVFVLTIRSGGSGAVFSGGGLLGIPTIFIGIVVAFVLYYVLSKVFPYEEDKIGAKFKRLYDNKGKESEEEKVTNTDLKVIGAGIVLLLITFAYRANAKAQLSAFPPLSGPFAVLTDGYFIVTATVFFIFCIYVLVRTRRWNKEIKLQEQKSDGTD